MEETATTNAEVHAMSIVSDERRQLCQLLADLGPAAPTLCEGWSTRDLATHLVVRERKPVTILAERMGVLTDYVKQADHAYRDMPWTELIDLIRTGPPLLSIYRMAEGPLNTAEYFVHHEDIRRAQPEWEPRPSNSDRDKVLWRYAVWAGRLNHRKSPVGVMFRKGSTGDGLWIKQGPNPVIISGQPGELLLYVFGRDQNQAEFTGSPSAIDAVKALSRAM